MLIGLASTMFLGVWILVIFQFSQNQHVEQSPVQADQGERVIPLPDSIRNQDEKLALNEEVSDVENGQEVGESERELEQAVEINLLEVDFSDISTPDGVPIEGILSKLELE